MTKQINKQCLKSGQVTVCMQDEGVSFSIKPLFGQAIKKIIPYNTIVKVGVGPKWWIFPGFRIFVKDDPEFYLEPGASFTGASFKHNQLTINPLHFKKWENFANSIREKMAMK